ncbi:hypothetical protein ACIPW4_14750 [Pseudomonas sp. NPDC089996]|uniref:hypothetical protein n=1 Tax=Pseudomonas sp. NPDC089996 TaxID=3364474 RepID=UPI00380FEE8D
MEKDNTPKQSGSIIFWAPENKNSAFTVPAEGSGKQDAKTVTTDYSLIEMSDIPSASTISFYYVYPITGAVSYIVLLSTHNPTSLNRTEYSYLLNSYSPGDFINEALGLKMIDKMDGPSGGDDLPSLIHCVISVSKSPPSE